MKNILIKILARLSICSCGFPTLRNDVQPGRVYRIPRFNATAYATYTCGGCGNKHETRCIMVFEDDKKTIGWLPRDLFDWEERPAPDLKEAGQRITALIKAGKKKTKRKSRL
jgi:hypothetical protein